MSFSLFILLLYQNCPNQDIRSVSILFLFIIYNYSKVNKGIDKDEIQEAIYKSYSLFSDYIQKIVSFEDYKFSLLQLFKLYMCAKVINILNEKFILLIITNIIMFYEPLENYSDHFLFKAKMAVIQVIEGTIGLISCLIPKYEEPKINDK